MILVNGDSFTAGEESTVAWPSLIPNTVNIATPGASNDHILISTVDYIEKNKNIDQVIVAWTTPDRITISGKHLTPNSQRRYGELVDMVFKDWNTSWAWDRFRTSAKMLHGYLEHREIPHVFISTFGIPAGSMSDSSWYWFGWATEGIIEWIGDCPRGPDGHPLELGHKRIADKVYEHIRNLGWVS